MNSCQPFEQQIDHLVYGQDGEPLDVSSLTRLANHARRCRRCQSQALENLVVRAALPRTRPEVPPSWKPDFAGRKSSLGAGRLAAALLAGVMLFGLGFLSGHEDGKPLSHEPSPPGVQSLKEPQRRLDPVLPQVILNDEVYRDGFLSGRTFAVRRSQ